MLQNCLLCHTYTLFERLILHRLAQKVDVKIIPEQVGFRPGKLCSEHLCKLTGDIEDEFEKGLIKADVFTVTANKRRLLANLLEMCKQILEVFTYGQTLGVIER